MGDSKPLEASGQSSGHHGSVAHLTSGKYVGTLCIIIEHNPGMTNISPRVNIFLSSIHLFFRLARDYRKNSIRSLKNIYINFYVNDVLIRPFM